MTPAQYSQALQSQNEGKRVGPFVYVHKSAVCSALEPIVEEATKHCEVAKEDFDLIKFHNKECQVSLLSYPDFDRDGFPALHAAWTVHLDTDEVRYRAYPNGSNRPVLHRKELTIGESDPRRAEFEALTRAAEAAGLFEDTEIIGHLWQWNEELIARGLSVNGHRLVQRTQDSCEKETKAIKRHRTALRRNRFSTPMQALWRHGFLDGTRTLFDYGCGHGDDLELLKSQDIAAQGWDPYFRPEGELQKSDVVNIGFVLNVVEDQEERADALRNAFSLAGEVLSVAALIGGRTAYEKYRLYRDGVITARDTFQKYFTQGELGQYIRLTLGREPLSIAPGIYFVFASDTAEQAFLERRQRSPFGRLRLKPLPKSMLTGRGKSTKSKRLNRWERNAGLVEEFWQTCLQLGRKPVDLEFPKEHKLRQNVGSPKTVFRKLLETRGAEELEQAQQQRRNGLLVYLALNFFERRKSFGALPERLRNDIKAIWGSYARAQDEAKALLFGIGQPALIAASVKEAAESDYGWLDEDGDLLFDARLLRQLPPLLRIYVGASSALYGEAEEADVVKVHIESGKVSLHVYDDYRVRAIPSLLERVKIDLRNQKVRFYDYGPTVAPQPLYLKSRLMHESLDGYEEQRAFDEQLLGLGLFDFSSFGPTPGDFCTAMVDAQIRISGHQIVPAAAT